MDAFASGELARFMLTLAALGPAPGFSFRGLAAELLHAVVMFFFGTRGGVFLRQAFLP
jgi:hypothetical protein